ncbi:MAG: hypothetical protein II949_08995 [Prevotella sp.]|nr:hypothetical protein [Prevotella sp.]
MNKNNYISPKIQILTLTIDLQLMAGSTTQSGLGSDVTNEEYNPSSGIKPSRKNDSFWDEEL